MRRLVLSLMVLAFATACSAVSDGTTADRASVLYASHHIETEDGVNITLRDGEQNGYATLTWELAEPMDTTITLRMPDPHSPEDGAEGSGFDPATLNWAPGETGPRSTAITTSPVLLNRDPDYSYLSETEQWQLWVRPVIEVGAAKARARAISVVVVREDS